VTITGIALGVGDSLGVGMHPEVAPITVHTSTPQLEACPPANDGTDPLPGWTGFGACRQFDSNAELTLPRTLGSTHVGWRLRAPGRATARAVTLTISYASADRYFVAIPPKAEPLAIRVTFTPTQSKVVGASALGTDSGFARNNAKVRLTQDGHALVPDRRVDPSAPVEGDTTYEATVGRPVQATVDTPGTAMLLEWQ
jgi:hypothetical protein